MRAAVEREASAVRAAVATLVLLGAVTGCAADAPIPARPTGPIPATLSIDGNDGADAVVDGVDVGTLPLPLPVAAEPGPHEVVVSMNGHVTERRVVDLHRGRTTTLAIDLRETGQRTGAWVSIGAGGGWVAAGVVFGVLALVEDRKARDLVQRLDQGVTAEEQGSYETALATRDRYRIASGIASGSGLALFVVGAFLFAFDEPTAQGADARAPRRVELTPVFGPGFAGATTEIRY